MNAEDVLKYGHQTVLHSIDGLTEAQCLVEGVCGWWSVRHIVAHLASHELVMNELLRQFLGEPQDTALFESFIQDPLAFNDIEVEKRRAASFADVVAEYTNAAAVTSELTARIPVVQRRQAGTIPWYGSEYDLEDLFAYSNYGHKREHCAQIAVYRDTLK
ncbi:MAG: DUF664 domain-containing protein [Anaerolineae bacterium]|nr:DUF664 domain-containing protein [Anaerolineae bacterium]